MDNGLVKTSAGPQKKVLHKLEVLIVAEEEKPIGYLSD